MKRREGEITPEIIERYSNPETEEYRAMSSDICRELNFTSLSFNRLDDMVKAVGISPCKLCTYCWNGKE